MNNMTSKTKISILTAIAIGVVLALDVDWSWKLILVSIFGYALKFGAELVEDEYEEGTLEARMEKKKSRKALVAIYNGLSEGLSEARKSKE